MTGRTGIASAAHPVMCERVAHGEPEWEAVGLTVRPGRRTQATRTSRSTMSGYLGRVVGTAGQPQAVFDSSDLLQVLAAKLTANGPDRRWTLVDVDGRGGGAIPEL